jgi:transposase
MANKRDHQQMEQRRRRAAKLFGRGLPAAEVARRCQVARQVAYRWQEAWMHGGEAALASKGSAGPKSRLNSQQKQQVVDALLAGPAAQGYQTQLWTLPRTADLIESLTGVRYHPGHVWRVLGDLGFSCQRPERRAIERDEQAVRQWKRTKWPALKKKRSGRAV